jgi:hypothetical protein
MTPRSIQTVVGLLMHWQPKYIKYVNGVPCDGAL